MTTLARQLRTIDYFTLGFGTMVGVGWLGVMDDWFERGGPLGAILGFASGGAALLPIGYVYGRLAMLLPDAGSEIAYTEKVFPPFVSFAAGWMMTLSYFVVCPWECVAVGKIAAYLFPALNSTKLYRIAGRPVYLPHLAIGLGLAALITALNYRGIRLSATFQNWMTFGLLALFALFASFGLARGSRENFTPLFSHAPLVSTLLMLQIVPYFMTGFESVPKSAEEANPEFRARGFFRAIMLALVLGVVFYVAVITVVALIHPWQSLTSERFATAVAFQDAFHARWIVNVILAAALLSLVKILNGNFIAATRLVFSLGWRKLFPARFGAVHATNQTPSTAVLALGTLTVAGALLGEAILIPITEVGSMASAVGWLASCASYYRLEPARRERCRRVALDPDEVLAHRSRTLQRIRIRGSGALGGNGTCVEETAMRETRKSKFENRRLPVASILRLRQSKSQKSKVKSQKPLTDGIRSLRQLAHQFRRKPPDELAGGFGREFEKGHQAAATFLESEVGVAAGAHQPRGELAQIGLVADHQNALAVHVLGEEGDERFGRAAGPQRVAIIPGDSGAKFFGHNLRRLGGADERT